MSRNRNNYKQENMFSELMREVPWQFKLIWLGSFLFSIAVVGFIIWVIISLLKHFGVI